MVTLAAAPEIEGGTVALMTNSAALLVVEPLLFVATTVYVPVSDVAVGEKTSVALVAPLIGSPFFFHWKVVVASPCIADERVTLLPTNSTWFIGWVLKIGGAMTVTVRTAGTVVRL